MKGKMIFKISRSTCCPLKEMYHRRTGLREAARLNG
jgi:hypothetical protein